MSNATTFVGLDVHARPVKACAFVPETGETIRKSFGYEPGEIASWVSSLPQSARCVYEGTVKNLAHFSDSLISPPSGAATPPAESRPDSASSPTRSRPRT